VTGEWSLGNINCEGGVREEGQGRGEIEGSSGRGNNEKENRAAGRKGTVGERRKVKSPRQKTVGVLNPCICGEPQKQLKELG